MPELVETYSVIIEGADDDENGSDGTDKEKEKEKNGDGEQPSEESVLSFDVVRAESPKAGVVDVLGVVKSEQPTKKLDVKMFRVDDDGEKVVYENTHEIDVTDMTIDIDLKEQPVGKQTYRLEFFAKLGDSA